MVNDHYSFSQLTSFDECPYAYYLQRIQGKEHPELVVLAENAFAQQGSLIHSLLDGWAKGEIAIDDLASEYQRRYPQEVTQSWPSMLSRKGYASKTYNQGLNYFENFQGFPGYTVISAEQEMETQIAGRRFVGYIDMILTDDKTGQLIILDHKSKSLKAFKSAQNEMYRQQYLYAKYVHQKYDVWPDKLAFNLFKQGGKIMMRDFDMKEYERTIKWAEEAIERIESFDYFDWMQTKEQSDFFCWQICSVRNMCQHGIRM